MAPHSTRMRPERRGRQFVHCLVAISALSASFISQNQVAGSSRGEATHSNHLWALPGFVLLADAAVSPSLSPTPLPTRSPVPTITSVPTSTPKPSNLPIPAPTRTYAPTGMPSVLPPGAKLKGREGSKLELYATLGFIGLGLVSGTVIWRLNKYHRRSMFNKRLKTLELRDASSQM